MRLRSRPISRAGPKSLRLRASVRIDRIALAGVLAIIGSAAAAADYSEKPVRLLVGFSAGGSADISARAIAKKLGETLATTMVIDNRGGAGGRTRAVNRVPACGM